MRRVATLVPALDAAGASLRGICRTLPPVEAILAKDHWALGKAITLVESTRPDDARRIGDLLRDLKATRKAKMPTTMESIPGTGSARPKPLKRIAISGSPGAGKSCFIEALGMYLCKDLNLTVGVIAVDPSSTMTKGSILGDKTRMTELSQHPNAFVRPSPSRGHLGGVQARCWEVMELLEAANFDVILVETVGVGQSEIAVKDMSDVFVLLVPPAAGDELQGVKKGIVEVADCVLVTKMDGDREKLALETRMAYLHAACYTNSGAKENKPVQCISSSTKVGIDSAWETITGIWDKRQEDGTLDANRKDQSLKHFHAYFELELKRRAEEKLAASVIRLEDKVVAGALSPREAAELAMSEVMK